MRIPLEDAIKHLRDEYDLSETGAKYFNWLLRQGIERSKAKERAGKVKDE